MNKRDLNRLNELDEKFENDPEYEEYMDLISKVNLEASLQKAEKTLIGVVDGDEYYLILPFNKIGFYDGKWGYQKRGFDMEIKRVSGGVTYLCQCLCERDAQYFVDIMLEDMKNKTNEEKGDKE